MPDLDQLISEQLSRPIAALAPPLGELQRRAARRRQRRLSAVAVGAAAGVAVALAAVGSGLPWQAGDPQAPSVAAGLRDGVLDAGVDSNGRWRVVVTRDDGWCVKRVASTGQGGACGLTPPGQLDEASQFPTFDGDEYVVVLAGPAPPGTNRIVVTSSGKTVVATVTEVDGRLFWTARVPPGDSGTRAVAYDRAGAVIDELAWPPAPDAGQAPSFPIAPRLDPPTCSAGYQCGGGSGDVPAPEGG